MGSSEGYEVGNGVTVGMKLGFGGSDGVGTAEEGKHKQYYEYHRTT